VVSYLDASAIAKLVLDEPESGAMLAFASARTGIVTSRIGVIEVRRAAARRAHDPAHLERVLRDIGILELDEVVARAASAVEPATIRTLDAIHLASAELIRAELDALVTYDDRLAVAARALGLTVVTPVADDPPG